jgi:hypothetical protein
MSAHSEFATPLNGRAAAGGLLGDAGTVGAVGGGLADGDAGADGDGSEEDGSGTATELRLGSGVTPASAAIRRRWPVPSLPDDGTSR